MSEIGLGLAALGRPAYINLGHADDLGPDRSVDALRAQTHVVLDHAYERGVRYFDAARSYGRAEEFLGSWLADRSPDGVFVASKWGYTYTANWRIDADEHEVKDLSVATLRRQLAETREHLGSWLQLYQIHSATLESGVLTDDEVLADLADLRATGVAVGLTVTGARQADTIDAALATGAFDAVQATWNLHERSAGEALGRAHAAGLRVVVKEAVANGRLTDRAAPPQLAAAARERGVGADAVALAAALAQPWSDVVLSGASTPAMLDSNLGALALSVEADAFADLVEPAEDYWSARSELAWT
ncbi:MAG TPA: aldo/keto reductase [Solirubrobacteraceae bacterium]|nr:aldo/keto reductase [Solirubrobacteraceae bacterium]